MTTASDRLKQTLRRYLDSSVELSRTLSKMTRSDLEQFIQEAARPGGDARLRLEDALEELRARSRRGADQLLELVRDEVRRDLEVVANKRRGSFSEVREDLADVIENAAARIVDLFPTRRGRPHDTADAADEDRPDEDDDPATKDGPVQLRPASSGGVGQAATAGRSPAPKKAATAARKATGAAKKTTGAASKATGAAKKDPGAAKNATGATARIPAAAKKTVASAKKATRAASPPPTTPPDRS